LHMLDRDCHVLATHVERQAALCHRLQELGLHLGDVCPAQVHREGVK
jgi:hypothetical protein